MARLGVFVFLLVVLMSVVCDKKSPVCAYPTTEKGTIEAKAPPAESVSKRITRSVQNAISQNYLNPRGEKRQMPRKKRDLGRRKFHPVPVLCG